MKNKLKSLKSYELYRWENYVHIIDEFYNSYVTQYKIRSFENDIKNLYQLLNKPEDKKTSTNN